MRFVQPLKVSMGFWLPDTEGTEERMCSIMTVWEFEKMERGLKGVEVDGAGGGGRGWRTKSTP
jgi:hypothetical protein